MRQEFCGRRSLLTRQTPSTDVVDNLDSVSQVQPFRQDEKRLIGGRPICAKLPKLCNWSEFQMFRCRWSWSADY